MHLRCVSAQLQLHLLQFDEKRKVGKKCSNLESLKFISTDRKQSQKELDMKEV